MIPRPLATVRLTVSLAFGLAACGGDGETDRNEPTPVVISVPEAAVADVAAAMEAVDEELGGAQQYFEVTANAQNVRLFVKVEGRDRVRSYLFVRGEVVPSGRAQPADGFTFAAGDVDLEPDVMLDAVAEAAPDATIEEFSIVGTQEGPPRYAAFARSERGGVIDVVLAEDGTVLEVAPGA